MATENMVCNNLMSVTSQIKVPCNKNRFKNYGECYYRFEPSCASTSTFSESIPLVQIAFFYISLKCEVEGQIQQLGQGLRLSW